MVTTKVRVPKTIPPTLTKTLSNTLGTLFLYFHLFHFRFVQRIHNWSFVSNSWFAVRILLAIVHPRKLRTNFVDDSFRPCDKSIYGEEVPAGHNGDRGDVTWLRPHEIDTGPGSGAIKWTLFRTPLPTDIIQGICINYLKFGRT